jgi:hypothetical protein
LPAPRKPVRMVVGMSAMIYKRWVVAINAKLAHHYMVATVALSKCCIKFNSARYCQKEKLNALRTHIAFNARFTDYAANPFKIG